MFRKKGVEVLILSDRVDEWALNFLTEFDGKELVSVAKGGLDLGTLEDEAEKKEQEKETGEFADVLTRMKASLGDAVKEVRVTMRLTDSPSCLVADDGEMSANLGADAQGRRAEGARNQADPRDQPAPCAGGEAEGGVGADERRKRHALRTTGRTCCSTRRRWPKAASSRTRRPSSSGSTRCSAPAPDRGTPLESPAPAGLFHSSAARQATVSTTSMLPRVAFEYGQT